MSMRLSLHTSLVRLSPNAASEGERELLTQLVDRLRSRDDAMVDRVLRELVPEVRRWMFRHLGPSGEVDDATQDALIEDNYFNVGDDALCVKSGIDYFGRQYGRPAANILFRR